MIALSLGSLPCCALLVRSRLIPRWLAALGLAGYATLLVRSALELYGFDLRLLHNLPGGIFELILSLWLLVRGFAKVIIDVERGSPSLTTCDDADSPHVLVILCVRN